MIDAFLHAALMMTTPILLAAIGGLVNRIGGLVNLGLESMMLAGALVAVIVSAKTDSSALATFAALGVGAVVGLAADDGDARRATPGAFDVEDALVVRQRPVDSE